MFEYISKIKYAEQIGEGFLILCVGYIVAYFVYTAIKPKKLPF